MYEGTRYFPLSLLGKGEEKRRKEESGEGQDGVVRRGGVGSESEFSGSFWKVKPTNEGKRKRNQNRPREPEVIKKKNCHFFFFKSGRI